MEKEQNTLSSIAPSELNTYQELFSFFDKDDSGTIPLSSVGMFIRGLGHCPTEAELEQILQ